ncbi:hypothetical protein BD31_I0793 [Candidatus Nitrosopumilus salaria BD31]|uniref:Uncharacterized protein n=1 Tax=Candidatus Nitrosopumilus salarius BD31 TaxID=859350 RepID=I3CZU3_9ARCH|nr:hypothetical protein BD31_I0793 [Candidatus Nitrosopumilus salaria BD31]
MRILKLRDPIIRNIMMNTRMGLLNQGNTDPVKKVSLSISTNPDI